jgi:chaperonin GroEL
MRWMLAMFPRLIRGPDNLYSRHDSLAFDRLELEIEAPASHIVRRALSAPLRQIAQNAGHDGTVVAGNLLREADPTMGFNAQTDKYENLIQSGVIDPTKVVRSALQDAASVAGLLITTEAAITDLAQDKPPMQAMPGGGMGGMGDMGF